MFINNGEHPMRQIIAQTFQTNAQARAVAKDAQLDRLMAAMQSFMAADFDDEIVAMLVHEDLANQNVLTKQAA
jgi:precorrin-6B methylase 2